MMFLVSTTSGQWPLGAMVSAVCCLVVGLVLWAAGRRVLRSSFALVGLMVGAVIGLAIGASINFGLPAWALGVFGGVVVACLAAVTYKLVLAFALALVLGLGSPLTVWTVMDVQQYLSNDSRAPELIGDDATADADEKPASASNALEDDLDLSWIFEGFQRLAEGANAGAGSATDSDLHVFDQDDDNIVTDVMTDAVGDVAQSTARSGLGTAAENLGMNRQAVDVQLDEAADFLSRLSDAFFDIWDRTPSGVRKTLIAAAVFGLAAGLLLGTMAPGASASVVTAFGGSLVWMASAVSIIGQTGASVRNWLPTAPAQLLALWVIVAIIGLFIQWTITRRKADTSSKRGQA